MLSLAGGQSGRDANPKGQTMSAVKILILVTSHALLGTTGQKTGLWLEEVAAPYLELVDAGAEIDIASPLGGKPPVDPSSEGGSSADVKRFLADPAAVRKLDATTRIDAITATYDAVFVAGGHGAMWDLAADASVAKLLSRHYQEGRVIATVCHGAGALVNATKKDGRPIVAGHRFAAFSNAEEAAVGKTEIVPFLIETRLREQGGTYEHAALWAAFTVRDGQLVTGQNPASSRSTAQETLNAVRALHAGQPR